MRGPLDRPRARDPHLGPLERAQQADQRVRLVVGDGFGRTRQQAAFRIAREDVEDGDVGQGAIEEVDRVQTTQSGLNLGWPLFEGTRALQGTGPAGITMPVTDVSHDLDARTLTIVADFAAPPKRIWEVYADPRQLERVWGPPGYPATFVDHDLVPGGRMTYYMTSPEGERYAGWWEVTEVDQPRSFTFRDGFADADDAWSETFLAALEAWPSLADDANVEAWLVTVAHRKALDIIRRRSRHAIPVAELPDRVSTIGVPEATDHDLWAALAGLPETPARAALLDAIAYVMDRRW